MSNGTEPVKLGIGETTDVLEAANELAILLITILKDGFQVYGDFATIFSKIREDDAFRKVLQDAYTNIRDVPAEMGDLDASEIIQLAGTQMGYLPRLLEAIKKQPE